MNYIYDISLNLNKNKIYDFYEWRDSDVPEFILKIPVYKVDINTYLDLKNNDIMVNKKFLETIQDKTETYSPNAISIIRYACVIMCEEEAFAIEFDSEGNNYMKSCLSIDEEIEIIDSSKNLKYSIIDYKIKKQVKRMNKFLTRKEEETEKKLIKKLKIMKENNENTKLKYIFYEVYSEKLDDMDKIYTKLINVCKNADNKFIKLHQILNLTETKNYD